MWIETCNLDIQDSMCGFRVYPLAATLALLPRVRGRRMDPKTTHAVLNSCTQGMLWAPGHRSGGTGASGVASASRRNIGQLMLAIGHQLLRYG